MREIIELLKGVDGDEERSLSTLHLTANEAPMSNTAKRYMASDIATRYYFGGGDEEGVVDFGPSTFRGLAGIQRLVARAEEVFKQKLGADWVSLGCLSGVHAMMSAILATTEPGDTVMSLELDHGGHFSTRTIIENMGRKWLGTNYDTAEQKFNVEMMAEAVSKYRVRAIYLDASFYTQPHDIRVIRELVGPDIVIIYDASHTLGLIMGGKFQRPLLDGADVICANTHKTFPGPQKGIVATRGKITARASEMIMGGLYSSPNTAGVIALAITALEMGRYGDDYASSVIGNAKRLASSLSVLGYDIRRQGASFTENHQVHLLTDKLGAYRELYARFNANNISVNFSDALGGRMFMRIGVQEATRRGMGVGEMDRIADFIDRTINGSDLLAKEVADFMLSHQDIYYSFDVKGY